MFEFYFEPDCDALFPKWWHKLIFWKKWKYPQYFIKTTPVSLEFISGKKVKDLLKK